MNHYGGGQNIDEDDNEGYDIEERDPCIYIVY